MYMDINRSYGHIIGPLLRQSILTEPKNARTAPLQSGLLDPIRIRVHAKLKGPTPRHQTLECSHERKRRHKSVRLWYKRLRRKLN